MTPEPAHARARATGPLPLAAGEPAPRGMIRLTRGDGTGQALPAWPDGATPSLLEEYHVAPVNVERAGETRRVLAAALKCCWTDLSADPWPGVPAPVEDVLAAYRALIGRGDDLMRNWAVGALRRLHDSAWLEVSAGTVRLGPRCACWPPESHAQLKELMRRLPSGDGTSGGLAVLPVAGAPRDGETTCEGPDACGPPSAGEDRPFVTEHTGTGGPEAEGTGAGRPESAGPGDAPGEEAGKTEAAGGPAGTPRVGGAGEGAGADAPAGVAVPGDVDEDLLGPFDERRRAEIVAAFMAVEYAAEPAHESRFPALRDPASRRTISEMLTRRGRTLIREREAWTSGYPEEVVAETGTTLGVAQRAVLALVLVHSVAIPRAEGLLPADSWSSPFPAPVDELRRHTKLPVGELEAALRALRQTGLLTQVKAGEEAGGYVPGPQFHRLTPQARRRLQEELILAAGPHTPLAAAVRAKRR